MALFWSLFRTCQAIKAPVLHLAQKGLKKGPQNGPKMALFGPFFGPLFQPLFRTCQIVPTRELDWPKKGSKRGPKMGPFWTPFSAPFQDLPDRPDQGAGLGPKGLKKGPKRGPKWAILGPFGPGGHPALDSHGTSWAGPEKAHFGPFWAHMAQIGPK